MVVAVVGNFEHRYYFADDYTDGNKEIDFNGVFDHSTLGLVGTVAQCVGVSVFFISPRSPVALRYAMPHSRYAIKMQTCQLDFFFECN